ncbi:MAG: aspartyl protease family protein [Acidobacteriota bacterium]
MEQESGKVNENQEATIKVEFNNGAMVEFLIDTGFSGSLCVPDSRLADLDLKISSQATIYGVGTHTETFGVAEAEIIWCGERLSKIAVYVNEGNDFLLGTLPNF